MNGTKVIFAWPVLSYSVVFRAVPGIVIKNVERIVKLLFYFSFVKCKNIRESHQNPTHRLCTSRGAINF